MFDFIDKILSSFISCFSRKAAFRWFVVLTLGLMLRSDKLGVTSVIRDLALKPDCYLSMIRLYSFRFQIECTFRELKQQTGAFCYHFWSKHMPRLNYYRKKTEPSALEQVESDHARRKIMQAVQAIEMHMALSCIAMGSIQCLSLRMEGKLYSEQIRYQRTPSKGKVSEGAMMHYLRKHIFRFMWQNPELHITRLIQEVQDQSEICEDLLAS